MKKLHAIEFFNKTAIIEPPSELRNKFEELLGMLPEYSSHVKKLGVFIAEIMDEDILNAAIKYTGSSAKPWVQKVPMASNFFGGVQAITVAEQEYRKLSENGKKRIILHELVHGICEHGIKGFSVIKSFQGQYFMCLQENQAIYAINSLINLHRDFDVDCLVAQKAPEIYMEAIYEYSKQLSLGKLGNIVDKLPIYARRWDVAIGLVDFYKNLSTLNCLPLDLHRKGRFKKAKNKFNILLKAARLWLIEFTNKTLPPVEEIISESDLTDLSKLMLCYSQIVA